ncbi:MAG: chemotaxis protein [Rhizobiales bacterium]|nr:chemotaxis protein [Hyphomicrobiales bacterium]OJY43104.1 MAG: chemotaxis protein [Rhizobiales bacterium 64-17]
MTHVFGFAIESMVAVLLLLTILYCVRLNKQLLRLKADEQSLRATIGELVTATEIAERAIAGLKVTASTTDQTLGQQLAKADMYSTALAKQIEAADVLMRKLAGIVAVSRPAAAAPAAQPQQPAMPDANSMAAAAAAFAERARLRLATGKAA